MLCIFPKSLAFVNPGVGLLSSIVEYFILNQKEKGHNMATWAQNKHDGHFCPPG